MRSQSTEKDDHGTMQKSIEQRENRKGKAFTLNEQKAEKQSLSKTQLCSTSIMIPIITVRLLAHVASREN